MGHGASLPQAGEEIQQTPVRSLLQVRLKNLVPEVYSVYYRSGGGLMCLCVCVCVIVKIKKTSVGVCGARRLENKN